MPGRTGTAGGAAGGKPLTVPQLRILRELAGGALLTAAKVDARAGGASDLRALAARGLVTRERIELDEGARETVWRIAPLGQAALGGAAVPARAADTEIEVPEIGAVAPWFGGCRRIAEAIGGLFKGVAWVGVPFAGGLSEIPWMLRAGVNAVALNDAHHHLMNMARTMADPVAGPRMARRLRRQPFAAEVLRDAQAFCAAREPDVGAMIDIDEEAAFHYFVSAWMSRSAEAGKKREFGAGLAIRWGAGGGNSVLRFANAAGFGIRAWRAILSRCSFSADDCFDFLARCNDRADGGIYADPPWPGVGAAYKHGFSDEQHAQLADALTRFERARVVARTGGGALIERLYPRARWAWLANAGRDQANAVAAEWVHLRNV